MDAENYAGTFLQNTSAKDNKHKKMTAIIISYKGDYMRKKKFFKKTAVVSLTAAMAVSSVSTAFAGQWQQDAKGWKFQTGANAFHTGGWQWIDGNGDGISECYYFGTDGYMAAGTTTPDGYTVNANGAWTENGTVKTRDDRMTVANGA